MVTLRIVNGVPEIDADPKEIASNQKEIVSLLRELNTPIPPSQEVLPNNNATKIAKPPELNQTLFSAPNIPICDYPDLPDVEMVVKLIDNGVKPIKYSMRAQQLKIWGKVIRTREEPQLYWQFYSLHQEAMKLLAEKYNGEWDEGKNEKVDGVSQTFFTLIEGGEDRSQSESSDSIPETTTVVENEDENEIIKN